MASMSYCAFENTVTDLRRCLAMLYEARESGLTLTQFIESRSSPYEGQSVEHLIVVAQEFVQVAEMMIDEDQ